MRNPIFTIYGILVLLTAGAASFTGWSPFTGGGQRIVSPKSVRDNPGAYRPIYGGYRRYSGGK